MTVSTPALAAYDDVQEVSLSTFAQRILVTAIRANGLSIHWENDPKGIWTAIPKVAPEYVQPLRHLSTAVLGGELCMAWNNPNSGKILFSRYDLLRGVVSRTPVAIVSGTTPALSPYQNGASLMMAYASNGQHLFLTTDDKGASWLVPPLVPLVGDAGSANITEIDVAVINPAGSDILWTETDLPLAGE
jgi:hypothetical protein